MYSIAEKLIRRLNSGGSEKIEISRDDTRLATAVLLYRVIQVDGRIRPEEVELYRRILEKHFDVSPDELSLFESAVEDASQAENTLAPFVDLVRKMPEEKRREIVEFMRDISLSDNEFHEFEVNLVGRTAELLDIEL